MQNLIIFVDDSGTLHKNSPHDYFIYAGYIFCNKEEKDKARREYKSLNKRIAKEFTDLDELKGSNLPSKNKRALYNVMRGYESFSASVNIGKVYEPMKTDKKSIVRYKDYVLKLTIKNKINKLIEDKKIDPHLDTKIEIYVDEQLTCTDGFYSLESSIFEEFKYGIVNFSYNVKFNPIFFGQLEVKANFCDSKTNYLVQASDILANRIFSAYKSKKGTLLPRSKHLNTKFP